MEKRREFNRTAIEVCRNCKAAGTVTGVSGDGHKQPCPICGGSGLIKKHIVGVMVVESYSKPDQP